MDLKNRVIVISGANGGLGRVVTRSLAVEGGKFVLLGRDVARLNILAAEVGLPDSDFLTIPIDLTNPQSVSIASDKVKGKFGKIDILLHFVGGWRGGTPLTDVVSNDVSDMLQQHLWTTYHLVQSFVPSMVEAKWGRIVAISSPFAASPRAKGGPYSIGKAAQEALLLTLAQELKGSGVTSNIILVKTIDLKHERETSPSAKNSSWTTPEEIADSIKYLISDDNRMINGARLPLYGSP